MAFHLLVSPPKVNSFSLLHRNPYPLINSVLQPSKEEEDFFSFFLSLVSKIMSKVQKKQNKNEQIEKKTVKREKKNL